MEIKENISAGPQLDPGNRLAVREPTKQIWERMLYIDWLPLEGPSTLGHTWLTLRCLTNITYSQACPPVPLFQAQAPGELP